MKSAFWGVLLCLFWAWPLSAQSLEDKFARADSAWDKRDYAAAETHFDRALELCANNEKARASALYGRGAVRLEQQKWVEARDDLTRCIEIEPRNSNAWMARGMARKALGDYDGLLSDAHEAARLDPEWKGFEDDAKSTVLYRRSMLGFLILAGILLSAGAIPMWRALWRVCQLERAGAGK